MPEKKRMPATAIISLRARIILYAATWCAALLVIDPRLWALAYLFPAGLFAFLPPGQPDERWAVPLLCFGWALYILHAVFFFRARQRRTMWIWYAVLLLLFVLNVGGCHQMLRGTGYGS